MYRTDFRKRATEKRHGKVLMYNESAVYTFLVKSERIYRQNLVYINAFTQS